MARPGSVAVGGFFATPSHLLAPIAALFKFQHSEKPSYSYNQNRFVVMDPCAGEGEALVELGLMIGGTQDREGRGSVEFYACELEKTRYEVLSERLRKIGWYQNTILHGDAFQVEARTESGGVGLLFLNPPYDFDAKFSRLEERFLSRFASFVRVGGALAFVVPYYALKASAATIAREFDNVHVFRFPGEDFDAFKQVVLIANKREPLFTPDPELEARILACSASADSIPELPENGPAVLTISAWTGYRALTEWRIREFDILGLMDKVRPWKQTQRSGVLTYVPHTIPETQIKDVMLRHYPVATPPRPAHIAAGIASGLFNGARIESRDCRLPPLLVKGVFDREYRTVEEKTNKDGDVTSVVQVQQPKLVTTVLDLKEQTYHILKNEETGSFKVSEMGVSDLLKHYGDSLMKVMETQCPILYDPRKDEHTVTLPSSPRKLFTAQAHAVRAIVRLLGGMPTPVRGSGRDRMRVLRRSVRERRSKAAILLGEIGSGKCLGLGTLVMKYDGTRVPVEQIQKGDLLMGPDSKPRRVLGTARGVGPLFRIVPVIGDAWVCNDAHILTLVHTMSDDIFDIPLQEYISHRRISRDLSRGGRTTHPREEFKQFTPENGVTFPPISEPAIDPYFLGLWYGDGTKEENTKGILAGVSVTTGDSVIAEYIANIAHTYGLTVNQLEHREGKCPRYHLSSGRTGGAPNLLLDRLRVFYGDGTHLPASCLYGSKETRQAFLAGFLDSDGHWDQGVYDFTQKRRQWSEDVCFIARSLGFRATLSPEQKSAYRDRNGDIYWRVCLSGDFTSLPMKLPRKVATPRATVRKNKKSDTSSGYRRMSCVTRTGITVEPIGEGHYAGFELDGDGRFLLGDFTVTHNTTVALMAGKTIGARRMLAMCPPHLLDSWKNEVAAVRPDARVVVLESIADVQALAADTSEEPVVAILSRETGKLGHSHEGVSGACPACGGTIPSIDLVKKRYRCEEQRLIPLDNGAKLALAVARKISLTVPKNPRVSQLLRHRVESARLEVLKDKEPAKFTGLSPALLDGVVDFLFAVHRALPEKRESAARGLVAVCLLDRSEARIEAIARRFMDVPSRGYEDEIMARSVLHLLPPHSEVQTRLVEEFKSAEARTSYWNDPWKNFASEVKVSTGNGESYQSVTVAGAKLTWHDGQLHLDGDKVSLLRAAERLLEALSSSSRFALSEQCGEPLYQATPEPRRYPVARYIAKWFPRLFDLLVLDEGHEYATDGSAQERSAHRLTSLGLPTILMTGTIMNGYAESLFTNMWALSADFRDEFNRDERGRFVERYGYRKRLLQDKEIQTGKVVAFGSHTDRVERTERTIGNAPGVLPVFLLRHLLPFAVTLHKTDLAIDLPPCRQERCLVEGGPELIRRFRRLQEALIQRIKRDQFDEVLAGKLFGQLAELPSYLDRATADVGNSEDGSYTIRYPESVGGNVVASEAPFPASLILPKEAWVLDTIEREIKEGRNVIVMAWHVGLLPRLARLISDRIGEPVPVLHADKVTTAKRQAWIDKEVVKKKRHALVTNPVAIQTGLNNLVHFSTEIWMENPACNPITFRQAVGRIDRIGQKKETRVLVPVYDGTLQIQLYDLLMHKVAVSISTDGLDPESAMRSAGIGEDDYLTGLSIGKQLWAMLSEGFSVAA